VVSLFSQPLPPSHLVLAGIAGSLIGLTLVLHDRNLRGLAVAVIALGALKGRHVFSPDPTGPDGVWSAVQVFGVMMAMFWVVSTIVINRQATRKTANQNPT
jgi:hypothetical protein